MLKLTKSFIDKAIPSVHMGQIIYRDDELVGFALRVTKRAKTFIVEKRVNGKNVRLSIGRYGVITASDARAQARVLLSAMARGIHPGSSSKLPSTVTLREAYEKFVEVRPLARTTRNHYRYAMEVCLRAWLDLPFISITRDMVEIRHQELSSAPTRLGTNGHQRADGAMQALRTILKFASERYSNDDEPLVRNNPVDRITINKQWHKKTVRRTVVPDNKLPAWYNAVCNLPNPAIRDYLLFVLLTGMRRTEAASIRWCHIDFERQVINVPKEITKTQQAFTIPISQFLKQLLHCRYAPGKEGFLFSSSRYPDRRIINVDYLFPEIRSACGYQFQIHDLRRTFLSTGAKLKVPFHILKSLVNHKIDAEITDRYIVIDIRSQRECVERIANELVLLMRADLTSPPFCKQRQPVGTSHDGDQSQLDTLASDEVP